MGFGYYVLGYLFTYVLSINAYRFAFIPVGMAFFLLGTAELRNYNDKFNYFIPILFLTFLNAVLGMVIGLGDLFLWEIPLVTGVLPKIQGWVDLILTSAVQLMLQYYLYIMAQQVDLQKQRRRALYSGIITAVYCFLNIFLSFGKAFLPGIFASFTALIGLVTVVINFIVLFSCYMYICPQGQEDMPRRQSRFAFINKMNAFRDEKERQTIESSNAYYQKRREERKQKKK